MYTWLSYWSCVDNTIIYVVPVCGLFANYESCDEYQFKSHKIHIYVLTRITQNNTGMYTKESSQQTCFFPDRTHLLLVIQMKSTQ